MRTLYSAGASCPFDEKNTSHAAGPLSRSRSSLRNNQLMTSSELKLVPMCPDHAPAIMYNVLIRASAANAPVRCTASISARSSRWNSSTGTYWSSSDSPWSVCMSPMSIVNYYEGRDGEAREGSLAISRRHRQIGGVAHGRKRSTVGDEPLGDHPVLRIVDVEALVPFADERDDDVAGNRAAVEHHARPRDLERRVLHV